MKNHPASVVIHSNEIYRNTFIKYMHFFGLQAVDFPSVQAAESAFITESPQLICLELPSQGKKPQAAMQVEEQLEKLSQAFPNLFLFGISPDRTPLSPSIKKYLIDSISEHDDVQVIQQKVLKWAKAIHSHYTIHNNLQQKNGWVDHDILLSRKTEQINLIPQLIQIFKSTSPPALTQIHLAAKSSAAELGVLAHKLKGMSANLGAHLFSEICKQIEFYSKEGMLAQAASLIQVLDFSFQQTLTELQEISDQIPPPP